MEKQSLTIFQMKKIDRGKSVRDFFQMVGKKFSFPSYDEDVRTETNLKYLWIRRFRNRILYTFQVSKTFLQTSKYFLALSTTETIALYVARV